MNPDFWRQIDRAREMTGNQRIREGLALFDRSIRIMTDGIRHQFPDASPDEVDRIRHIRLSKIRSMESL